MGSLTKRVQDEKKLRYAFLGAEATGLLITYFISPVLGIPVIAMGVYVGWRWFQYRVKNGMRF